VEDDAPPQSDSPNAAAEAAVETPLGSPSAFNVGWVCFAVSAFAALGWIGWRWYDCPPPLDKLRLYVDEQAWELATPGLRRLREHYPHDRETSLLYARALAGQERFVESAEALAEAVGSPCERAETLFRAGQAVLYAKLRRTAERYWKAALELPADDPGAVVWQQEARRELCNLLAVERRSAELARTTADMLRAALPSERHQPLVFRARSLTVVIDPASVIPQLEEAVAADPDDLESLCALGLYRIDAEKIADGKKALADCRQARPDDPYIWESWCWALDKIGEVDELAAAVRTAPKSVENAAAAARFRSLVAEQSDNDLAKAIVETERAIELDPDPALRQRLGQLLTRTGKRDEGKRLLDRVQKQQASLMQLRDAVEQFHVNYQPGEKSGAPMAERIASVFHDLGRTAEAREWRRFALVVDPNFKPSATALEKSFSERAP
jgi:tetratricopeptide (TPR) repeat protein